MERYEPYLRPGRDRLALTQSESDMVDCVSALLKSMHSPEFQWATYESEAVEKQLATVVNLAKHHAATTGILLSEKYEERYPAHVQQAQGLSGLILGPLALSTGLDTTRLLPDANNRDQLQEAIRNEVERNDVNPHWFDFLFIAQPQDDGPAGAHMRLASVMRTALGLVDKLHSQARAVRPERCLPLNEMAHVYGLAVTGVHCTLYGMTLEDVDGNTQFVSSFPVQCQVNPCRSPPACGLIPWTTRLAPSNSQEYWRRSCQLQRRGRNESTTGFSVFMTRGSQHQSRRVLSRNNSGVLNAAPRM